MRLKEEIRTMEAVMDGEFASVSVSRVTDAVYLDQAVEEVFGLMLGVPVDVVAEEAPRGEESATITAMVGLAGVISGTCAVLVPSAAAIHMSGCMAGMELTVVDETVLDGLGEITNMLAGAWKSKIPELNGAVMLSVPTVVTGTHYEVHRKEPAFLVERYYKLGEHCFTVRVYGVIQ
jgi:chemotaxis protein CheX